MNQSVKEKVIEMLEFAKHDKELEDGLIWIARRALQKRSNLYDEVVEVLKEHNRRTKDGESKE